MSDATCKTCSLWTREECIDVVTLVATPHETMGVCHHASANADPGGPRRSQDWWCSEHPLRQRDRLAAMAMQGLCAPGDVYNAGDAECVARHAYAVADAMLAERAKGTP